MAHELSDRLAEMRREYAEIGLHEDGLAPTWLEQFRRWFAEAEDAGMPEPNAMVLATADAEGRPAARNVLLKGADEHGLVFFTNKGSRKGRHLAANPQAALLFSWIPQERQIELCGRVEHVDDAQADAYFARRPHRSRVGAAVSPQSELLESRSVLEDAAARLAERHPEDVPRPEGWGGYRLVPDSVEFWQGRADRLHDRLRFRLADGGAWVVERLWP